MKQNEKDAVRSGKGVSKSIMFHVEAELSPKQLDLFKKVHNVMKLGNAGKSTLDHIEEIMDLFIQRNVLPQESGGTREGVRG